MTACQFEDQVPISAQLTSYDESHFATYLCLLDAETAGADWREAAASIFGIDVIAEPDRAKVMYESHLSRAHWMTEIGYSYLLGRSTP